MRPNESTDIGSEASTSRESAESKLIVFIVHDWEIYCLDDLTFIFATLMFVLIICFNF